MLQNREFCVMCDDNKGIDISRDTKGHLEKLIKKHGGVPVANPGEFTRFCILYL